MLLNFCVTNIFGQRWKLTTSKNEARRLIKNRGIKLNDKVVEDDKMILNNTFLTENSFFKLSLGKKKHYKVIIT